MTTEKEISKKVDLLGVPQKKYERYYLARNPFPAVAMSPTFRESQLNKAFKTFCEEARKEELDRIWENFIRPAYQEGISINHWLEAEVGGGKSAIMIYLDQLLKDRMKTKEDIVSLYAPIGNGFSDVYSCVVSQLGKNFFEETIYRILNAVFLSNLDKILIEPSDENKETVKKLIEKDFLVVREVFHPPEEPILPLAIIDKERLKRALLAELAGNIKCSQLIKETHSRRAILLQFLDDPETAFQNLALLYRNFRFDALLDFIYLFEKAGYVTTYLFLDQLDHQVVYAHWGRGKLDKIMMRIRLLVVESLGNLATIATSYPFLSAQLRGSEELIAALPWTDERVTLLTPLSNEDVRSIFVKYLQSERTKEDVPELAPFKIGAVDKINEMQRGNIRDILINARSILEKAANEGVDVITSEFLDEYYRVQTEG